MSIPAAPPESFNFAQHLIEVNQGRPGKTAFIDDIGSLSYGALDQRIRKMAAGLRSLGLRREERVLLLMQDGIDWPVAFLGALYAGIVPVAVNTLLTADEYAYMLRHSRAQAALVSSALMAVLQSALAAGPNEIKHLLVSGRAGESPKGALGLEPFLDAQPPLQEPAGTAADEPAFWLYSSGSTGRPKGTVHTHANLWWTAKLYGKRVLGLTEQDIAFSAAKLFFAYGLGNSLTFPLSVGATVLLMAERATPEACFKRWTEAKPTLFFGAPTGYAAMLAAEEFPSRSQVALRLCCSAGEALPRDIGERFRARLGCEVLDGIGSTEMLHIFLSNRPGEVRYGTTGRPVDGYEVDLRGEDGRSVPAGAIGELYVRGPSAALMYWNDRRRSRDTFQGGWTKSGDKYRRDADGWYVYAGRSDDMLKVSGQYVSPFEVEAMLIEHPKVLEAAVVGVADAEGLTKPKAFIVLKAGEEGSAALEAELKAFAKSRLALHKYPRIIQFIDTLPKTATGKIQRFKLRERDRPKAGG